jgi:hypothetical protein
MPGLNITIDEAISWFRKPMLEDIENHNMLPIT